VQISRPFATIVLTFANSHSYAPVYIGTEAPINTTANEPAADVDTLLRVLKVSVAVCMDSFLLTHSD
jgi:hypothetical protein